MLIINVALNKSNGKKSAHMLNQRRYVSDK